MCALNGIPLKYAAVTLGFLLWTTSCSEQPPSTVSPIAEWSKRTFVVNVINDGTSGSAVKSDDLVKHDSSFFSTLQWPQVGTKSYALSSWKDGVNHMVLLIGSCGGELKTGRYLAYAKDKHCISDVFASVATAMGVPTATFGEPSICKGPLPGLTMS